MQAPSPELIERIDAKGVPVAQRRPRRSHAEEQSAPAAKASRHASAYPVAWPDVTEMAVCVVGFDAREREFLDAVVKLSLRRGPRLSLVSPARAHLADVLLVDGSQPRALQWARSQSWLARRPVVWVGAPSSCEGHISLTKPVAWPVLPAVLARALREAPRTGTGLATRERQPDAPMVMVLSDDTETRHRLRRHLEVIGCRVTGVSRAREGLAALHAADYRCILVAGDLADASALELARRLRELSPRIGHVPLVRLQAGGSALERLRARWAGYDLWSDVPRTRRDWTGLLGPILTRPRATPVATPAGTEALAA